MPMTPVYEAHHSERGDVIKGRGAKGADPTVPCKPSPSAVAVRMIIVAVALAGAYAFRLIGSFTQLLS